MNPSRPFILRPIATSLLMVGVLLAGLVGYMLLPVSALPEVEYPTIQVATFYPGASPDVTASAITAPLERQFGEVPGLNQMTSISSGGASIITLQFTLDLNIDVAEQEVQAAINASGSFLPKDLPAPPVYSKINPADAPILTLALTSKTMPLSQVEDLADTRLAQKLSQLTGVGLVDISGGQKPAVRIRANPTLLSSFGLTFEDIRTAVAAANVNQAKGNFDGPHQAYTIGANDQLLSSADYKPLIIAYRNNAPVHLSDIANVVDDTENVRQAAWINGTPAVIMNIRRQPGANIIQVVDRVNGLLPQLRESLPPSVQATVVADRTTTIRASVKDVEFELLLTIALVVMVIFLFLRTVSATIIPSVAVPLALVGTFGVMYLLGYSLNNLTLMALTIATGFVVDDAIVMIENIMRYVEQGEKPLDAALKGAEQIGFTIMSLTVSLIAVLIPLLFMSDVVGRLFREFAITLSITILVSAIVSLTLTPMMAARLLKHRPESEQGRFYRVSERAFQRTIDAYGRTLTWVLEHQPLTLIIAVATLVLTILLYIVIPKGFFPVQDTGEITGISEAPQAISFAAMEERQQALASVILKDPAVAGISSFIGVDGTNTTMNSGRLQIELKPLAERHIDASSIIRRLEPELDKVQGVSLYMQPVQDLTVEDRVSRTEFQYSLEDPDLNELSTWAPRFVNNLQTLPQLRDVASDLQTNGLQAKVVIDRNTAARFGITPQMVDDVLYDAFGQRQISTMYTQLNYYRVVLEAEPGFQRQPQDLSDIYVNATQAAGTTALATAATTAPATAGTTAPTTGTGAPATPAATAGTTSTRPPSDVPLSTFTNVELTNTPLAISHQGQFPATTISFNLAPNSSLGDAVTAVQKVKDALGMPASVQGQFQGTALAFQASLVNTPLLILAAIVCVYIVLGVLYESYIHPVTILSTLPSAGVGALLAMMITGTEFSIVALIGIVLLIGIVQKNAIMMVDFALEAERQEHKAPRDAIFEAAQLRFRPILMTTMAALLAGLPLALGSGTGAELRRPLGIAIVGGLIFSQILTLYTTPVIYLAFDRLAKRIGHRRSLEARS